MFLFVDESGNPHLTGSDPVFAVGGICVVDSQMLLRAVRKIYRTLPRAGRVGEIKGSMLTDQVRGRFFREVCECYPAGTARALVVIVDMEEIRKDQELSGTLDRHGKIIHEIAFDSLLRLAPLDLATRNIEIHVDPRRRTLTPQFLSSRERSLRGSIKRVGVNISSIASHSSLGIQAAHIVTNSLFRVAAANRHRVPGALGDWAILSLNSIFLTPGDIRMLLCGG